MIELHGIVKRYAMGEEIVQALAGVDLHIARNEYVALIGPSGSGKSTLMNLIGCLDTPTEGRYVLNGRDTSSMTDDELAVALARSAVERAASDPDERDVVPLQLRADALLGEVSGAVRRGGGRSLRGQDLAGRYLRNEALTDADLRGALLLGADLRGLDLGQADLLAHRPSSSSWGASGPDRGPSSGGVLEGGDPSGARSSSSASSGSSSPMAV